ARPLGAAAAGGGAAAAGPPWRRRHPGRRLGRGLHGLAAPPAGRAAGRRVAVRRAAARAGFLARDLVDHLVDPLHVEVLHEGGHLVLSLQLGVLVLRTPRAELLEGPVEQPERHDLVFIADVARVVRALEARREVVGVGFPRAAELVEGAWLEAAGAEQAE